MGLRPVTGEVPPGRHLPGGTSGEDLRGGTSRRGRPCRARRRRAAGAPAARFTLRGWVRTSLWRPEQPGGTSPGGGGTSGGTSARYLPTFLPIFFTNRPDPPQDAPTELPKRFKDREKTLSACDQRWVLSSQSASRTVKKGARAARNIPQSHTVSYSIR